MCPLPLCCVPSPTALCVRTQCAVCPRPLCCVPSPPRLCSRPLRCNLAHLSALSPRAPYAHHSSEATGGVVTKGVLKSPRLRGSAGSEGSCSGVHPIPHPTSQIQDGVSTRTGRGTWERVQVCPSRLAPGTSLCSSFCSAPKRRFLCGSGGQLPASLRHRPSPSLPISGTAPPLSGTARPCPALPTLRYCPSPRHCPVPSRHSFPFCGTASLSRALPVFPGPLWLFNVGGVWRQFGRVGEACRTQRRGAGRQASTFVRCGVAMTPTVSNRLALLYSEDRNREPGGTRGLMLVLPQERARPPGRLFLSAGVRP